MVGSKRRSGPANGLFLSAKSAQMMIMLGLPLVVFLGRTLLHMFKHQMLRSHHSMYIIFINIYYIDRHPRLHCMDYVIQNASPECSSRVLLSDILIN